MLIAGKKLVDQAVKRTTLETMAPRNIWGMTYNCRFENHRFSTETLTKEAGRRLETLKLIQRSQGE